jgi:hypothetical protein
LNADYHPVKRDDRPAAEERVMPSSPELDPELQELLDLEAQERGEAEFVASHTGGGAQLDPELQELMDLEEQERNQGR